MSNETADTLNQNDKRCLFCLRTARYYLHLARASAIEAAEIAESTDVKQMANCFVYECDAVTKADGVLRSKEFEL